MKIRPLRAELLHADRRTDEHDEANSRFSQCCGVTRLKFFHFAQICAFPTKVHYTASYSAIPQY